MRPAAELQRTAQNPESCAAGPPREQFIPLRKAELVETLVGSEGLSESDAASFRRFCRLLEALVHNEYHGTLEELKNAYAPFDPDADTHSAAQLSNEGLEKQQEILFRRFGWLMERGNFRRLAQQEIDAALGNCSQWGINLKIDFEIFERLEIYARGDVIGTRYRRRLKNRLRTEAVEVPVYQRLAVIFRLRTGQNFSKYLDTQDVHIKLFKDIPKADLDMLLPGTQFKMSMLDRVKILLPTLSGITITVWKLVQGALLFAIIGVYGMLALIGGTIGYGVRSLYGYLNTRQKYQLNLTQSLYYQNLDNNAGAIHRLLDEAEEQENREAMLAYFFLWRHAPAAGWTSEELDERIEAFLRVHAARDVDFEIGDALDKLERLAIVESAPAGRWKAVVIERALAGMAGRWATLPC